MRNNVFAATRTSNTSLMPLFPLYLGRGCIVPTVASFRGAPGRSFGKFQHSNSVDEINICFGSNGARRRAGQVQVGPRKHAVGGAFADAQDPNSFYIASITQRQAEEGGQYETVAFLCSQCQHELVHHDFEEHFDAVPGDAPPGYEMILSTNYDSPIAAEMQHANLTCPECGHVNEPFPVEMWGWHRYLEKSKRIVDAWKAYNGALVSEAARATS